jgi:hypothetical protein
MNPNCNTYGSEPEEPRDPAWLRWLKFASIVLIPAVGCGLVLFGVDYFAQYQRMRIDSTHALQDTGMRMTNEFRNYFIAGACIGGGAGLFYVIRCIVRKVDP